MATVQSCSHLLTVEPRLSERTSFRRPFLPICKMFAVRADAPTGPGQDAMSEKHLLYQAVCIHTEGNAHVSQISARYPPTRLL